MKKVLFILSENFSIGVIQSQVLSHIELIQKNKIAKFTIVFCYWSIEELSKSKEFLRKIKHKIICKVHFLKIFRPALLFLNFVNQERLFKKIIKINEKFDYIHARTDYCAILCKNLAKKLNLKLIWDCRGDSSAEVDYEKLPLLKHLKKIYLNYRFKMAGKISKKIIFVSNHLKLKYLDYNIKINEKKIFVIPSTASKNLFFYSKNLRKKYRNKLKIKENTIVFIYSGSIKQYQNFNKTIDFFKKQYSIHNNIFLIVLTQNIKEAKEVVGKEKNIVIKSVLYEQVNNYLNAADFGILIRNNDSTNFAASPTKFAEYCMSGLKVITTSSVRDYFKYSREKIKNIIEIEKFNILFKSNFNRKKIASFYIKEISRESYLSEYKKIYD